MNKDTLKLKKTNFKIWFKYEWRKAGREWRMLRLFMITFLVITIVFGALFYSIAQNPTLHKINAKFERWLDSE